MYGIEHLKTATSYNNIGSIYDNIGLDYNNIGEYEKALEYYFKALDILDRELGTKHPNTKKVREHIEEVKAKQAR